MRSEITSFLIELCCFSVSLTICRLPVCVLIRKCSFEPFMWNWVLFEKEQVCCIYLEAWPCRWSWQDVARYSAALFFWDLAVLTGYYGMVVNYNTCVTRNMFCTSQWLNVWLNHWLKSLFSSSILWFQKLMEASPVTKRIYAGCQPAFD